MVMKLPGISQAVLTDFHTKHFSLDSRDHFATHFLGPVEDNYNDEEYLEDDGLGYYADGVKRTLTDEQIAIFRHSEIETLLRERRYAEEAKQNDDSPALSIGPVQPVVDLEDGEMDDNVAAPGSQTKPTSTSSLQTSKRKTSKQKAKQRKAQSAKEKGFFKQNIKPDLRKRTWDKVDTGMDTLMYDDEGSGSVAPDPASQRRKISYDDD